MVLTGPGGAGALDADGTPGRRRARSSPGSRPARSPATRSCSSASRGRRPAAAPRPRPGAPDEPVDTLPEPRPGPGRRAPRAARLGRTSPRAARCSSSTTRTSRPTRVAAPGRGAAVLRIKGTDEGARRDDRRQRPGRPAGPVAGRGDRRSPRPPATSRSPARGRSASRTASTTATRPGPRRSGSSPRASAGLGDACRALGLPVTGGNVSPLQRGARARRSRRRPRSGSWGCWTTSRARVGPALPRGRRRRSCCSARPAPGSPARRTAASPARRPRTARRRSTSTASAPSSAFIREAIDRGLVECCQDVRGGGLAVALAEMRIWGDRGARLRLPVGDSPAVDLFGESPSRVVCEVLPARTSRRSSCWPASTACPVEALGATGGDRLVTSSSPATGATGAAEERGGRDRRRARRAGRGPPARLGARAAAGRSAGTRRVRLMCGVVGVVLPTGATRRPPSPRPRCSRSSTAARSRRASASPTAASLMIYKDLGMVAQVLDERRIPSLPGDLAIAHCRYSTTGLDGLGERPADAPPRAAAGARHRPQRQPRQHPRAARRSSPAAAAASPRAPTRSS